MIYFLLLLLCVNIVNQVQTPNYGPVLGKVIMVVIETIRDIITNFKICGNETVRNLETPQCAFLMGPV